MNFNTVDLYKELQKLRNKEITPLEEAKRILQQEVEYEHEIIERIGNNLEPTNFEEFVLEEDKIYTLDQIKRLCIKYRLRFLDSKVFKGEIPHEAIAKIKMIEKQTKTTLKSFKVIAPKELFRLEDKDSDPILFLQLSKDKFYFIHKWGGEINKLRSVLAFPLRNFMTMFWFLLALAFLFTLLIPTDNVNIFAFLFVHSFIAICGIACLLIFSQRENFSNVEWDSKYLS